MPMLVWDERQLVGHDQVDKQHAQIFQLVNYLNGQVESGASKEALFETLQKLYDLILENISTEESMMFEHGYPERARHRAAHMNVVAKASEIMNHCSRGKTVLTIMLANLWNDFLFTHMQEEDIPFFKWFNEFRRSI